MITFSILQHSFNIFSHETDCHKRRPSYTHMAGCGEARVRVGLRSRTQPTLALKASLPPLSNSSASMRGVHKGRKAVGTPLSEGQFRVSSAATLIRGEPSAVASHPHKACLIPLFTLG